MHKVTVADILAWEPCEKYDEASIRKLFGRRKSVTVADILLAPIPTQDRLWCVLREECMTPKQLRLFACQCAERALEREHKAGREPDKRSWEAIAVAHRFAIGEATIEELAVARDAAWAAAWAAEAAAWGAEAAAWGAKAAAWATAEEAEEAAWRATRAEEDAAGAAAWEAEQRWQISAVVKIVSSHESC
jgi:hypothetical protein